MTAQQTATPTTTAENEGMGFVGSWLVTFFEEHGPPTLALATVNSDGTVVASEHPVVTPPIASGVVFTSAGHGAWVPTGPGTVAFSLVGLGSYGDGVFFGTVTGHATIRLGNDGQTFSGDVVWTVADPAGQPLATFPGTFQATRIVANGSLASS